MKSKQQKSNKNVLQTFELQIVCMCFSARTIDAICIEKRTDFDEKLVGCWIVTRHLIRNNIYDHLDQRSWS